MFHRLLSIFMPRTCTSLLEERESSIVVTYLIYGQVILNKSQHGVVNYKWKKTLIDALIKASHNLKCSDRC
jgi:hypothetical protein